jgi:D-allulose-6-phosphate 3-epimerase
VGTSGLFSLADNVSDAWDKMVDIYQREVAA